MFLISGLESEQIKVGMRVKEFCNNSEKVALLPYRIHALGKTFSNPSLFFVKFSTSTLVLSILASKHKNVICKYNCSK